MVHPGGFRAVGGLAVLSPLCGRLRGFEMPADRRRIGPPWRPRSLCGRLRAPLPISAYTRASVSTLKSLHSVADVPKKVQKTSSEKLTFLILCDSSMILGGFSGLACPGPPGSPL